MNFLQLLKVKKQVIISKRNKNLSNLVINELLLPLKKHRIKYNGSYIRLLSAELAVVLTTHWLGTTITVPQRTIHKLIKL